MRPMGPTDDDGLQAPPKDMVIKSDKACFKRALFDLLRIDLDGLVFAFIRKLFKMSILRWLG